MGPIRKGPATPIKRSIVGLCDCDVVASRLSEVLAPWVADAGLREVTNIAAQRGKWLQYSVEHVG